MNDGNLTFPLAECPRSNSACWAFQQAKKISWLNHKDHKYLTIIDNCSMSTLEYMSNTMGLQEENLTPPTSQVTEAETAISVKKLDFAFAALEEGAESTSRNNVDTGKDNKGGCSSFADLVHNAVASYYTEWHAKAIIFIVLCFWLAFAAARGKEGGLECDLSIERFFRWATAMLFFEITCVTFSPGFDLDYENGGWELTCSVVFSFIFVQVLAGLQF
jgi:hypothetical protein